MLLKVICMSVLLQICVNGSLICCLFFHVETCVKSLMQDEDFPASELNKDVSGRGWQSSRF